MKSVYIMYLPRHDRLYGDFMTNEVFLENYVHLSPEGFSKSYWIREGSGKVLEVPWEYAEELEK